MKKGILIGAATAVVAVAATASIAAVAIGGGVRPPPPQASSTPGAASTRSPVPTTTAGLARAFFADWVTGGRVVRHDQGGDTVSEGQAYALLIAAGNRDEKDFASVWNWTAQHLQRPDGLLAWRWSDGKIVDDEPATDADLDAARALLIAGDTMNHPEWTKAGTALAGQIADRLTVETQDGRILLPGLWAATAEPFAYNPSYAAPAAFAVIANYTKDARWTQLEAGTRAATTTILKQTALPPDWAQVHADGTIDPMPGARGSGQSVRYGYDAARLPLRLAESCDPADRKLSAALAAPLDRTAALPAELDLGAGPLTTDQHPLAYLARAASRAAAGDDARALADLRRADALAATVRTYYGSAWAALAPLYLGSTRLGGCAELPGAGNPAGSS
ncbi:hypothetical protein GCM10027406_05160 [Leifsonia lichenia]